MQSQQVIKIEAAPLPPTEGVLLSAAQGLVVVSSPTIVQPTSEEIARYTDTRRLYESHR